QPALETDEGYAQGSAPVSFIFKNVMENSLRYLDIEPDKEHENETKEISISDLNTNNIKKAKKKLEEQGLNVIVIGLGDKVVAANVAEGEKLLPNDRVLLLSDKATMPDITGWTLRDVFQLGKLLELDVHINGNGYDVSQSIDSNKSRKKLGCLTLSDDHLGMNLKKEKY